MRCEVGMNGCRDAYADGIIGRNPARDLLNRGGIDSELASNLRRYLVRQRRMCWAFPTSGPLGWVGIKIVRDNPSSVFASMLPSGRAERCLLDRTRMAARNLSKLFRNADRKTPFLPTRLWFHVTQDDASIAQRSSLWFLVVHFFLPRAGSCG
jgi:hypothetical protein